jgi:hypothetical protein
MITPYLWWRSLHDSQVHAFPAAQTTEQESNLYRAACTYCAPVNELVHRREGHVCTACLIRVGSRLPEPSLVNAT